MSANRLCFETFFLVGFAWIFLLLKWTVFGYALNSEKIFLQDDCIIFSSHNYWES